MDLLVNIDVDDLPKAIAFYQQAAGNYLRPYREFKSAIREFSALIRES